MQIFEQRKCSLRFFLMNFVIRTHNSDLSRPDDTVTYFRIKTRQHKKVINYFSIKILHEKQLPIIILTRLTCLIKTKVYTKKKHRRRRQSPAEQKSIQREKNFFNFASGTEKVIGMLTKDVI